MEIALFIAALIVSLIVFTWLIRVVKATVTTALTLAFVVLVLQLLFGIGPQDLFQTLSNILRQLWQAIAG
ncbi:MAG: hypothetical protein AAGA75_05200 [Cyanobacteria bacterium P01_E01_bin.6]